MKKLEYIKDLLLLAFWSIAFGIKTFFEIIYEGIKGVLRIK